MRQLDLTGDDRLATAAADGARWLEHLQRWRPDALDELSTGAHEAAVILLSGTFDLVGGTTSWPARGARTTPFEGRPMAVFLPPETPLKVATDAARGPGEILWIAARQPAVERAPEQREALSQKPLLPLAGSGKAFDPSTGEWKPAETFATAAESLPPRRFLRLQAGDVRIERVFAEDYKAATLSVDELVVPAGKALALADVPERPSCDEALLFVRAQGAAELACGDDRIALTGNPDAPADAAFTFAPDELDAVTLRADDAAAYAVVAYAGK